MNRTTRTVAWTMAMLATVGTAAWGQGGRVRPPRTPPTPPANAIRHVSIPLVDVSNMLARMRVYLVRPPQGVTAFGLGGMGEGHRVWVLLPSCRQPNPDDPRDPCPVGRLTVEVFAGTGDIRGGEPQTVTESADARRVQSFVVPASATQLRLRLLRPNDQVRYEATIDAANLDQLPTAEGNAGGARGFTFDLPRYPAL